MKKSVWISFCGWAALASLLVVAGMSVVNGLTGVHVVPVGLGAVGLVVVFPAFGLWLLGTAVHRLRVGGAKMRAEAMVQAQRASTALRCAMCKQRVAVVRCINHSTELCPTCWGQHHAEGCAYAQLTDLPPAPRAVVR